MKTMPITIRDERLPHLGVLLNVSCMRDLLAQKLFAPRYRLTNCEILQCRFKPGKNCLVSFALTVFDEHSQQTQTQIVYAKTYPEGTSQAHFAKAQRQNIVAPPLGKALLHIAAYELVLWTFPNDRKLAALPDLIEAERLQTEIMPRVVAQAVGANWRIAAARQSIMHYVAEHTCTFKINVDLVQPASGKTHAITVFGKTYYNDQGAQTWRAMQQLQQRNVHIATPLCYQPELQTFWQLGLNGTTLNATLQAGGEGTNALPSAAQTVAQLHQSFLADLPVVSLIEVLEKLSFVQQLIAQTKPEFAARVAVLIAWLRKQFLTLQPRPQATLHGDLHLKNFFVMRDKIALIDLDNLASGDPLLDLGSFVANLHTRALCGEIPACDELITAFLQAYQQSVAWTVPAADLRWFVVIGLLRERVARCITRLKNLDQLDALLTLAERISAGEEV